MNSTVNSRKTFKKELRLIKKLVRQFETRLEMYVEGVRDAPINDHPLTGKLTGSRAFSINGDIRVIYVETETKIIFLDIGSHSQVYGN